MPNMLSVKTNSVLFFTEEKCMETLISYLNIYESKSEKYKKNLKTIGFCLPFESFPIKNKHNNETRTGTES
tara:strand:+ start:878 stop:1090 length:213 start_codon:yes stop_codon:yes gene_type:complete